MRGVGGNVSGMKKGVVAMGGSYQGWLLRLWGARRAVRGGWTAPVTGIGHVPVRQGLKRRQSVLIHRDAVQGLCKHCQQVGLIFFIYLLRRWQK